MNMPCIYKDSFLKTCFCTFRTLCQEGSNLSEHALYLQGLIFENVFFVLFVHCVKKVLI